MDKETAGEAIKRLSDDLNILGEGKDILDELGGALGDIVFISTQLNKTFTQNRQRIEEMQYAIADAIPGVFRLGGKIEDVGQTIGEIAKASNRNVIANTESVEKLYAAGQILETTTENIVNKFANIGVTFNNVGKQLETSIAYVQSIGGNAAAVMETVLDNTEQLNRFNFATGVEGLTKMAAKAAMLRIDMQQTFSLAEEALDPERAVELSSAFQRLGVMSGTLSDPFQLMNQSINDPEGLQDSIVNMTKQFTYFDEKTKSFKINPQGMLTLREIQKQTNLSAAELSKAGLAAAELDARLSSISPRITFANEEDKQYLANIASMNEKGEYTVKLKDDAGREYMKNLADVNQEEMNKLIEEQKKGPQTLEDIQRSQLSLTENMSNDIRAIKGKLFAGIVTAPTIVKGMEGVREVLTTVAGTASKKDSGIFDTPSVRGYSERAFGGIVDMIKDVVSGDKTILESAGDTLSGAMNFFKDLETDFGLGSEKYLQNLDESFKKQGITTDLFNNILKQEVDPSKENAKKTVESLENLNKTLSRTSSVIDQSKTLSSEPEVYGELSESTESTLGSLGLSFKEGIDKYSNKFNDFLNNIKENTATPEDLKKWLDQSGGEIKKYSGELYSSMLSVSDKIQGGFKSMSAPEVKIGDFKGTEPEVYGELDESIENIGNSLEKLNSSKTEPSIDSKSEDIDKIIGEYKSSADKIGQSFGTSMEGYKNGLNDLIKEVQQNSKDPEAIMNYVKDNKINMEKFGAPFYEGMEKYASEVSTKITKDNEILKEVNTLIKDVESGNKNLADLDKYIIQNQTKLEEAGFKFDEKNSDTFEKLKSEMINYGKQGKSSLIEGQQRSYEPIQSGQIQGGQSLTQIIQHKVEFGKITVDVQLPGNFSQLSTEQQQKILDQVFNHSKFINLINTVDKLGQPDIKIKQAGQGTNSKGQTF
jgi:dGTP triphosphohydrolase